MENCILCQRRRRRRRRRLKNDGRCICIIWNSWCTKSLYYNIFVSRNRGSPLNSICKCIVAAAAGERAVFEFYDANGKQTTENNIIIFFHISLAVITIYSSKNSFLGEKKYKNISRYKWVPIIGIRMMGGMRADEATENF